MRRDRKSKKREEDTGGDNEMVMRQMSFNTKPVPQVSASH